MSTASQHAPSRKIDVPARPAARSSWQPVRWVTPDDARLIMPPRWLSEVLVLALIGLLLGAAALYGLAAVSPQVTRPATSSIAADCSLAPDYNGATGPFGVWDGSLLCVEMR